MLQGLGWGIWLVLYVRMKKKIGKGDIVRSANVWLPQNKKNLALSFILKRFFHSQFVHKVIPQILSDMFMPGLLHAMHRRCCCWWQIPYSTHTRAICHQLAVGTLLHLKFREYSWNHLTTNVTNNVQSCNYCKLGVGKFLARKENYVTLISTLLLS